MLLLRDALAVDKSRDQATNASVRDFTVERDATPPQVWVSAPAGVIGGAFTVTWGAVDAQAGVAWYALDISMDGGPWQSVLTHTPITAYQHTNPPNTHVTFRVTATDHASDSAVSGTYAETAAGRTYTFPARNVRYVRDYLNGSNKDNENHWVEIEVWGFHTTAHVGAHYEKDVTGNVATSYYTVGGRRIAQRRAGVVYYLHTDHLGSASLTTDASGNRVGELRYKPYGETRYIWGVMRTDRRYTGQVEDAATGLYFYNARYYDPLLARFISADTIVPSPSSSQALNRYSYVLNSPLNYRDPSGHAACLDAECNLVENPVTGEIIQRGTSRIWVYPYNRSGLGEAYQYQGEGTNDCGPTNLAMVINLRLRQQGVPGNPVKAQPLGEAMQNTSRGFGFRGYRLTGLTFRHKGATPPWGMVGAFNEFNTELLAAGGPDLGRAEYRNHGTKADLISNVRHGYYTTIMLVWEEGGAHYITIVGYEADADVFYYLDPGRDLNNLLPADRVQIKSWSEINKDWSRKLLWMQNAMITFYPGQH